MSDNIDYETGPTYRVPRRSAMDGGTKRLVMIAGGLGAVLLGVVGVYTLAGHRGSGHVPVIEADSRPLKVKPDNPGGMQLAGSNDEILSGDPSPQAGKLAPPPEMPKPQALRPRAAPPPPEAAEHKAAGAGATDLAEDDPPESTLTTSAPAAAAPLAAPTAPAPAPAPAASAPAAAQAPAKPVPAAAGAVAVQLAALETEAEAKTEWARLARKMPDVLGGRTPAFSRTERDGKIWWRLRTAGFTDAAQARAFCDKVRAKGGGCSVVAS